MTSMLQSQVILSSEGRWPRICELRALPGESRVALLCMHTSPLAAPGKSRDAGGMNIYVRELARHLGRRGIAVDIFTRWTDPTLPQIMAIGVKARLIHIPAGPIAPLHKNDLFAHVAQFVDGIDCFAVSQRLDYQIIHSHYWLSGVAGIDLARRWGAPHIVMFHTLARLKQRARPEEEELPLRIEQERHVLAEADSIVVATEDERQQILHLYGTPHGAIHTIPCGVDLGGFTPLDRTKAREQVAAALHLDDRPLVLFVGRLDPLKGADLLVRAWSRLQTAATLVIVGGDESDPERARLGALACAEGVADRVRLVNAVPHDQLSRYYRAADLLAIASHYESFGLVAVEALASGTPVIAPDVGGLSAIVQDGINGALVAQRTPAAFAQRIDVLLRDPAELARWHDSARPSVRHFGWHAVAGQIANLYAAMGMVHMSLAAG
jgi:D-inositol-3-phosphate glycosyltransferase